MQSVIRRRLGNLRREDGHTLTEMLVVIAIIALIAAVLTPQLLGQLSRARAKTAQLQLERQDAEQLELDELLHDFELDLSGFQAF